MPPALRAYWAKKRGAKRKHHTKRRRHHARAPRVQQQPIYILVD